MSGEKEDAVWPLPKFCFTVDIGDMGTSLRFQEVSGLETETQVIEYRAGNSTAFSTIKMPGIAKIGNVTLRKGMFVNANRFWDWYSKVKMNTIKREGVTIKLLAEGGEPTMIWRLSNAWPTKITSADLKAEGNEVAVETLEIAHEGMTIENP